VSDTQDAVKQEVGATYALLIITFSLLVISGVALVSVNDTEDVLQGIGFLLLVLATIPALIALVTTIRRRRGRGV
jgi:hypothetical protein